MAEGVRLPLFAKDEFKEALYDALGTGDVAWSRRLGIATYGLLYRAAEAELLVGRSFVLEANFASSEATEALASLCERAPFRALQLVCGGDPEVLLGRYVARAEGRHRGHLDLQRVDEVRNAIARRYDLAVPGEIVHVDTNDFAVVDVSIDSSIARAAGSWVGPRAAPARSSRCARGRGPQPSRIARGPGSDPVEGGRGSSRNPRKRVRPP